MLVNRESIYRVKLHLRKFDVKVIVHIKHIVTAQTYFKDGDYTIDIEQDTIEYLSDKKPTLKQISEEVFLSFQKFKPNLTAVSAVEFSV